MHDRQTAFTYGNGSSRAKIRTAYLIANAFELFTAILAMVACVSYVVEPQNLSDGSIGSIQFPDVLWNGLYGAGAVLVVGGLFLLAPRVEVMGLSLFASAVLIQAVAVGNLRGWSGAAAVAIYTGFAGASVVRAVVLVRGVNQARADRKSAERREARQ